MPRAALNRLLKGFNPPWKAQRSPRTSKCHAGHSGLIGPCVMCSTEHDKLPKSAYVDVFLPLARALYALCWSALGMEPVPVLSTKSRNPSTACWKSTFNCSHKARNFRSPSVLNYRSPKKEPERRSGAFRLHWTLILTTTLRCRLGVVQL